MTTFLLALAVVVGWLLLATGLAWLLSALIDARDRAHEGARDTLASPADAAWERITPR